MRQAVNDIAMTECPFEPGVGRGSVRRWLLAGAGVVCVGLGALGVFVPGLPTTVFLIMASWLFTKSCPWLERKLIRNRLFSPYLGYLDGNTRMPRKAKAVTLAAMWGFVSVSCVLLIETVPGLWVPALVVAAAGLGTFFVVRQGCHLKTAQTPGRVSDPTEPGACPLASSGNAAA
ncbi:MAG: uncharacterized membrane protein YbaN (DUF454 family) [Phycisphaerales bacterium]|jgi:uncharacterized membrane protein YbaN (DUF454 family)